MAEAIAIEHVSYRYQSAGREVLAVDDVSLQVAPAEFVCVLGPSGCGKTTIMNMIVGFLHPTQGTIRIGDGSDDAGSNRGVVFQDFAQLFPWRTARRNVEFGLEMRKIPTAERRETAMEFLRLVGLTKFADAFPHELSGGMQQRVAIARALAYNPGVLLMDEPFAALDAMTREEMQRLVTDIWQKTRKTVVYVTHNISEAVYLADRVIVLAAHPGKLKAEFRLTLPRPRDPLAPEFIEAQREISAALGVH
ncbi:Bicarbonate transport ATP-binding protein CmpD [Variovorax sp. PBL-H6]|jgi:NitT/TauT family transport system ATP-binding protein|uniref:ABC transporter ATP-binding protein n=1 Tax=Variovorax sp. PBL-H6 TaxID=434009 RepID=UPI001319A9AD|nr:ABC transporter ATP-binding protein [Variovorax sp. PBL-H6]VTU16253.1 Bicarbonate transport ATP-binding protein CmpD [Variovorax sp. PBL-H6]